MAKAPKPPKEKKPGGDGRSVVWLSGLVCGAVAAMTPGIALVAGVLLLPGLAALKFEQESGKPAARAMLTCGLAGGAHHVATLWNAGPSLDTAIMIVTDPMVAGLAWSAAAAGWLMTELAPLGVRAALEASALARTARLRAARERIAAAWGLEGEE